MVIPLCVGIFWGECGLGGVLGGHPKFLPRLRPHVFLISSGLLELQLQGLLYLFSRRSRSTLPGLGVPIDGGIALAPLREVLPEPGVVQFLA